MIPILGAEFPKKVIPLIDVAKHTIDVCVFDWRWYPNDVGSPVTRFNQSFVAAARRGVKVRALVNNLGVSQYLHSVGIKSKHLVSSRLLHCKLMILDSKIVITGSHNYTQSAFQYNFELSVILNDLTDTSDFRNFFNFLWGSH